MIPVKSILKTYVVNSLTRRCGCDMVVAPTTGADESKSRVELRIGESGRVFVDAAELIAAINKATGGTVDA